VLAFDDADEDRPMALRVLDDADEDRLALRVPYIADESIERNAEVLLAQFAQSKGLPLRAPIPIEDIVEKHLKLTVDFRDLHSLFGVPRGSVGESDIFGAIRLETGEIFIDESLDPDVRPSIEGRYRFTLAHEGGGHWRLHRPLVQAHSSQPLPSGDTQRTTVICRSSRAKERVELQADLYASCLLMPRKLVAEAWRNEFGNDNPRVLRRNDREAIVLCDIEEEMAMVGDKVDRARSIFILERCLLRPLAKQFLVSPVAMRIRLEKLGLLYREAPQRTLRIQQ
jgi:Zn-dependent peptidase ImmA (M78 family)